MTREGKKQYFVKLMDTDNKVVLAAETGLLSNATEMMALQELQREYDRIGEHLKALIKETKLLPASISDLLKG